MGYGWGLAFSFWAKGKGLMFIWCRDAYLEMTTTGGGWCRVRKYPPNPGGEVGYVDPNPTDLHNPKLQFSISWICKIVS